MKFCPRCFKVMSEAWAKKANYDPRHKLDVKRMIFPCQIPLFEPGNGGEPMVRIYDCRAKRTRLIGLDEYRRMKAQKEL